jgi:hypothetical protein
MVPFRFFSIRPLRDVPRPPDLQGPPTMEQPGAAQTLLPLCLHPQMARPATLVLALFAQTSRSSFVLHTISHWLSFSLFFLSCIFFFSGFLGVLVIRSPIGFYSPLLAASRCFRLYRLHDVPPVEKTHSLQRTHKGTKCAAVSPTLMRAR